MVGKVLLGFEVGTGQPVYMPVHHLAVFGISQLSGKTTALEALITRSGLKAVAFITKRGERGFTKYRLIPPYYKPRSDWMYVESLVNVALGEKVKYEPGMRLAIIKVSQGRRDLRDVRRAAVEWAERTRSQFMKSAFEKLVAYLDIVVPELERHSFSDRLELDEGVNVMDLSAMRTETQHLVIASTIEYVFQNLDHTVIVIPEAWETMPQSKMTPVKWVAEQFIRKGAAIGNYLWIDAQDIGGISKVPLRQCDNWLLGRMKEAHEVERVLKQLLGAKIKADEIQTLPLGHFFAVIGNEVKKVYVLPAGVPEEVGRKVAMGELTPEHVRDTFLMPRIAETNDSCRSRELERTLGAKIEELQKRIAQLEGENAQLKGELERLEPYRKLAEALSQLFQSVQPAQPKIAIDVDHVEHEYVVHKSKKVVKVSTESVAGQILYTALTYFKDRDFSFGELMDKMLEHGWNVKSSTLSAKLSLLVNEGKLIKTEGGYRLPSKVSFSVEEG